MHGGLGDDGMAESCRRRMESCVLQTGDRMLDSVPRSAAGTTPILPLEEEKRGAATQPKHASSPGGLQLSPLQGGSGEDRMADAAAVTITPLTPPGEDLQRKVRQHKHAPSEGSRQPSRLEGGPGASATPSLSPDA